MSPSRRAACLLTGLVAALAAPLPAAAAPDVDGPTSRELEAILENLPREDTRLVPAEPSAPPGRPEPTALTMLTDVLAELDGPRGEALPGKARDAAQERGRAALRELQSASPDLPAIVMRTGDAVRVLTDDDALAARLAEVAGTIAADLLSVVPSTARERELLALARSADAQGRRHLADGSPVRAVDRFAEAVRLISLGLAFDIARFEQNIRDRIEDRSIGFAYAIARKGQLHAKGAGGYARLPFDVPFGQFPPFVAQSPTKPMYVASISKTITALSTLKLLESTGRSVEDSIRPYLPVGWLQGPGVAALSFDDLLRHRSGLPKDSQNTFDALGQVIAAGTSSTPPAGLEYNNANFALLRVLIPHLLVGNPHLAFPQLRHVPLSALTASIYQWYVQAAVLTPSHVEAACAPSEGATTRTLYYDDAAPSHGLDHGDWTHRCGATGWHLSAVELSSIFAHLRYTDAILSPETRALMDARYLGWLNPVMFPSFTTGAFGVYRGHGGNYKHVTGCALNYPVDVQATLLVNSTGPRACEILVEAFDDAWTL